MKIYYPLTIDLYNPYLLPVMNAQQNNIGRGGDGDAYRWRCGD